MDNTTQLTRKIPLLQEADVCVVGGGSAGFAAAIAAARLGTNVILIERYGILGGTATISLTPHFDPINMIGIGGIVDELYARLKSADAIEEPTVRDIQIPFTFWESGCGFDIEEFKFTVQEMLEEAGARLLLHSLAIDVICQNGVVKNVIIANKSGWQAVAAKIFIDATGDGDIAAFSGAKYEMGNMAMTPCFRIGNVDIDKVKNYLKENPDEFGMHPKLGRYMQDYNKSNIMSGFQRIVKKAIEHGDLEPLREVGFSFNLLPIEGQVAVNTFGIGGLDPLNIEDLTKAEKESKRRIRQIVRFARKYLPGFESSCLVDSAVQIGIRESRRVSGDYVLTLSDIEQSRRFEDSIVEAKWAHTDVHDPLTQMWTFRLIEGPYQIPYRCLLPKGIENLLVSGRCISVTHEALASARIMPICMATGQAAGAAAGLAVKSKRKLRELDVKELQRTLRDQGARL